MKTLEKKNSHTQLPWVVQRAEAPTSIWGTSSHGGRIGVATTGFNTGRIRGADDAAFIVKAVNNHADLIAVLEALSSPEYGFETARMTPEWCLRARSILEKATA